MDVSCEHEVSQMFKSIIQHYSRPPCVVVNCAGITQDSLMVKMTEEHFSKVLDVNLKGNFFIVKHLGQLLMEHKIRNASIINIASIVGKTGNIGQANYTASKAGVVALTKTTALEFARFGHRCNAVLPGFIKTAMTEKVPPQVQEQVKSMIPLGEFGDPSDIAKTCLFLASDQSRYITGASIEVTGGLGM